MNILTVDDSVTNQMLIKAQLEKAGHHVIQAADGLEALEKLNQGSIDIVITDLLMPNMDGFSLCYRIRSFPQYKTISVIIYSATHISPEDKRLAVACGADIFLEKNGRATELLDNIHRLRQDVMIKIPTLKQPPEEVQILKQYSALLVSKLEEKNRELTEKVGELETFKTTSVNRENQVIELRKEVNALCKQLGKPEPYRMNS